LSTRPLSIFALVDNNSGMSENNLQPVVPRDVLAKQGLSAAACLAGGAFLMLMTIGAHHGLFGIILPVLSLAIGIGALLSRDMEDKKPGFVFTAAGVLGMIMRFVRIPPLQAVAGTVLTIGALGLLAVGIWNGVKFFRGLKTRQ